ncbi:transcriptional repressor [Arcanobacterium haemolyticum]|nr:transcriptional repressor [Arcanobacterium haemolyticum]
MNALLAHPHSDADALVAHVRAELGTVSRQAIYDVLKALTDAGIARRVLTDGHGSRYELDPHDNHHHLVCTACGRVEDIPCATGNAPCIHPPLSLGVKVHIAEVVYRGLCSHCVTQAEH